MARQHIKSRMLVTVLISLGLAASPVAGLSTTRSEFTATEEEIKYFCGLSWEDCLTACEYGTHQGCSITQTCGKGITRAEVVTIAETAGFSHHLGEILALLSSGNRGFVVVNIGSSRAYSQCLSVSLLEPYETGIWIFKTTKHRIWSLYAIRLNEDEDRVELLSRREEFNWAEQQDEHAWVTQRAAHTMGVEFVTDDWNRLFRIFEYPKPVAIESIVLAEAEKGLLSDDWKQISPHFLPGGWLLYKPVRFQLWDDFCEQQRDFTCFGNSKADPVSPRYRFYERNRGFLIVRFDSTQTITGTWLYSAFVPYEIFRNSRSLSFWTADALQTQELASRNLRQLAYDSWGEAPKDPMYRFAFGAAAAHSTWDNGDVVDWRSEDGQYRFIKSIYDSGDFAVARYSSSGLDQILHFRGLEGTTTYVPPRPPVVDILSVTPERQFVGAPLQVELRSRSVVDSIEITVNGQPHVYQSPEPGVWTATIRPSWFDNQVRVTLTNESGTVSQTATVWYYPVSLIGGTLLVLFGTLIYLWHSRHQRNLERERRQEIQHKREQALLEDLAQFNLYIDNEFYEEAEAFLEQLEEKYPEQRTTIEQARHRAAIPTHRTENANLRDASEQYEDLDSRIRSSSGFLIFDSERKRKGRDK